MQVISSRKNAAVSHMKKLGNDRAYRYEQNEFLCDGIRLLREAVAGGCLVTAVFAAGKRLRELESTLPVYEVTDDIMAYASPLKTAQDVLFSCRMPERRDIGLTENNIVLDSIGDPGNVGTVLRGANAFRIGSVILCGACADPYNPKTVRASMGAIFRQNIIQMDYGELAKCVSQGMTLYGAALGEGSRDVRGLRLSGVSVAVGNEGAGLSGEVLALCGERIIIPMEPQAESLNAGVAASIFMWMMYGGALNADA